MGWWTALGVLTLLAILPLGVSAIYNSDGPLVRLIVGPVRLILFPRKNKDKPKKAKPQKAKQKNAPSAKQQKKTQTGKGGSISDFMPLVQLILDFLGTFRKKLRVNVLELKLIMAADDPCDLAVNYGKAWAALGNLMPHLERIFVIKKRNLEVECDFTSDQTLINARLDITITLGRALALSVCYGFRGLRDLMKLMNKSKGGAKI